MTLAATNLRGATAPQSAAGHPLRPILLAMHVAVSILAVFSVCTNRFDLWIDLLPLGSAGAAIVETIWVASVLLVPWCAGPRLAVLSTQAWLNEGCSPTWARHLLWPTWLLLACLAANSVYYYHLLAHHRVDSQIPIPTPLLVGILLLAWALATHRWATVGNRGANAREHGAAGGDGGAKGGKRGSNGKTTAKSGAAWESKILAAAYALALTALAGSIFWLESYHHPPPKPVDLAVVLGNLVLPDGTASATLRDRTLAAVNLYKHGMAKHLYLSGAISPPANPGGPPLNEPAAMLQVCLQNGVPESAITLDVAGVNTRATAFNAHNYMKKRGLKTVVACSDDYHLFRTALSFREVGVEAYTVAGVRTDWPCVEWPHVLREFAAIGVYELDRSYRAPKEVHMALKSPRVVVRKALGVLEIYDGTGSDRTQVKVYPCITGGNAGDKAVEGDRKTPLGTFHVVYKNENSNYHLSLGLDYPTAEDAQRGLASGLISQAEYDGILAALQSDLSLKANQKMLWYTKLGGEIFIHGHGTGRPATAGCVAVSDPDIDEIFAALPIGTEVEIRP